MERVLLETPAFREARERRAFAFVVDDALAAWLDVLDAEAPSAVEGLYVVGSAALGDWTPQSDVDVVAVVADPSDAEVIEAANEHDIAMVFTGMRHFKH